jgi:hypothetical protein
MNFTFDLDIISDLHKDARGYRPDPDFWKFLAVASPEQKQRVWDELLSELEVSMAKDEQRERLAVGDFERGVRQYLALGEPDRHSAIVRMLRGVMTEFDLTYGGERACYLFSLPFSYTEELTAAVQTIINSREST